MTQLTPVFPRQAAPALEVQTTDGDTWRLADQTPENFSLAVMYRGKDSLGEVQGGPMYVISEGLGPRWRPLAWPWQATATRRPP